MQEQAHTATQAQAPQTSPLWQPQHTAQLCAPHGDRPSPPGHTVVPIVTSSGFPSTDIQQTHTQTASCHINHTDTHDPSQSGNKPANTTYALPPTRLKARSLKASLGLPRSSLCTLDDPGRPVSQQVPCSSVHARVCWDLEVRAALLNPARTHAHTHTLTDPTHSLC